MPTAARTRSERRRRKAAAWATCGGVVLAIGSFVLPKAPFVLILAAVISFVATIPVARTGYIDKAKPAIWVPIVLAHAALISLILWTIWPAVVTNPKHVTFAGYPNETFNFSVRNGTVDDVYDVQIPFPIGINRHLDAKFSAKVLPNGDPPQRIYSDYNYCYGKGPDVHNVLPNEQEVFIIRIPHIQPSGSASFSITYTGGEKIETKPGKPNYVSEPTSYSTMQGTMGVRGDYRICKFVISTDGLAKQ